MNIIIQERDLRIFRFINGMRNGDADILGCYFFTSRVTARIRLNLLSSKGYLRKCSSLSPNGYIRYRLTKKSYSLMRSYFSQVNIPKMYSGVKFFDSQHERMIAISRLYLVKNNISDGYLAEREIASEMIAQNQTIKRRFLPDAIFYNKQTRVSWFLEAMSLMIS